MSEKADQEDRAQGEDELSTEAGPGHEEIELRARKAALSTVDGFIAFGFGSGLLTKAPGTMGTLAAVPVAIVVDMLGFSLAWFAFITFWLGVWVCARVTRALDIEDYGGIVWDEMVGFWLVAAFIPQHWAWYIGAFVLFRGFDILKPWPISKLEEALEGGLGIMLDDVLAAVYAILVLAFIHNMIVGA
ncbi:MAG: phosphatidylglycerophosphatase A [Xanthomonadales bacterium]|nr:phosphatidylglycerophosphatase A [Xanthomonadales bacterium]NNL95860.1 phosphatidylglycerophosphatase A [Xanthomonadales bacterium]